MKSFMIVSAIASTFAIIACAQSVELRAQLTDTLVDVGSLDTFWSVWNRMYDVSDGSGGLSDVTRPAYNWNCQSGTTGTQLSTRTILGGQWGNAPGTMAGKCGMLSSELCGVWLKSPASSSPIRSTLNAQATDERELRANLALHVVPMLGLDARTADAAATC